MDFEFEKDTFQEEVTEQEQVVEEAKSKAQKKKNEAIVAEVANSIADDEEEKYQKRLAEKRKARSSFNDDMESPLAFLKPYIDKDTRFEYHLFNDKPGRIKSMMTKGWELVYDEELAKLTGQADIKGPVEVPTGLHDSSEPTTAYLMKIEKELFEEDKAKKLKINQDKMDSIHNLSSNKFEDNIKIENS